MTFLGVNSSFPCSSLLTQSQARRPEVGPSFTLESLLGYLRGQKNVLSYEQAKIRHVGQPHEMIHALTARVCLIRDVTERATQVIPDCGCKEFRRAEDQTLPRAMRWQT